MTEATASGTVGYAPGTFCRVELVAGDSEGAKRFYAELFGWDFVEGPGGRGAAYTLLRREGEEVGALYPLSASRARG
jgi:uncharacterized protein